MNLDSYLLKYSTTREGYEEISKFLEPNSLSQELKHIYQTIQSYYEEYPEHNYLAADELKSYFQLCYPTIKDKDKIEHYELLIDRIFAAEISDTTLSAIKRKYLNRIYSQRISSEILSGIDNGDSDLENVGELIEKYKASVEQAQEAEEQDSPFASKSWAVVVEEEEAEGGLEWHLSTINQNLGPLSRGVLGHVFAPPDTGKTTFLTDQVSHFAKQFAAEDAEPSRIIWINNEERVTKVLTRIYQSFLDATEEELKQADVDAVERSFQREGGAYVEVVDRAAMYLKEIEEIIAEYRPYLVLIDQAPKIKQRNDQDKKEQDRLFELYKNYRELTKNYDCSIISVGQANGEAYGRRYLRLDMMNNSRIAIQGELDFAIGIGAEEKTPDLRYLSGCKSKFGPHWQDKALFRPDIGHYYDYD